MGLDRMGGRVGSEARVTVGLSKGTGVEVYCFMERSLFSCWCVHSGGRESSYLFGGILQGGAGDTQLEDPLLSPFSGATMTNQDCNEKQHTSVSNAAPESIKFKRNGLKNHPKH